MSRSPAVQSRRLRANLSKLMGGVEVPLNQPLVQIQSKRKHEEVQFDGTMSIVYGPVDGSAETPAGLYLAVEETVTDAHQPPLISSVDLRIPLDRASVRVLRQLFNVLDAAWQMTEEDDRRISQAIRQATAADVAKFGKPSR